MMPKTAVRPVKVRSSLRPDLRTGLMFLGRMLLTALLVRARLLGEPSPFAPAFFASALVQGWHPSYLLAGCMLGGILSDAGLWSCLSCVLIFLMYLGVRPAAPKKPLRGTRADGFCMISALLGVFVPRLLFSGGLTYNIVISALCAVCAGMLSPALLSALTVRPSRRTLMGEEQLSLALLVLLFLASLCQAGAFLSRSAAVLCTLCASFGGCGMGALAGISAGSALALGGSDPFIGSSLCLCGILAGCVRSMNRPIACLLFAAGNTLSITWGLGYSLGVVEFAPLLCGCIVYCLIPRPALIRLRGWMAPRLPNADMERLAVRVRRRAGQKLSEISSVFGELADGCGEQSDLPTEAQVMTRLGDALCKGCPEYSACRQDKTARFERMMRRLAMHALSASEESLSSALPDEYKKHCRRFLHLDRRLAPLLSALTEERGAALRRGEGRSLMGRQFRQAQKLLDSLVTHLDSEVCLNEEYALLARSALDRAGIHCSDVLAVLDDRLEIVCVLREGTWSVRRARRAARLLSSEIGLPFSPVLRHGRVAGECELYLMQVPALCVRFACRSLAKQDDTPCGDSCRVQQLSDGRFLAALSDGMGSGDAAAKESDRCATLLRKFVAAGVERDAALSAVNQLLLMRGGDEMFATADLCVINLYSGAASFSKLGACPSYILRGNQVSEISGGRLPLGILDRVEPSDVRTEVFPDDLILLFSDGVADELKDGQCEALKTFLPSLSSASPAQAVSRILDWATARDGASRADDMTVIALRIEVRR